MDCKSNQCPDLAESTKACESLGAIEFLNTLFDRAKPDDGVIVTASPKEHYFQRGEMFSVGAIDQAAEYIKQNPENLFIKTGLFDPDKIHARGKFAVGGQAETRTVLGLCLDVDAKKGYADTQTAWDAIYRMPVPPTMVIRSSGEGGGFHVYWLFDTPVRVTSKEEVQKLAQLFNAWRKLLCEKINERLDDQQRQKIADHRGAKFNVDKLVDRTHNPSGVLRPPESIRSNGNAVDIAFLCSKNRYTLEQLTAPGWEPPKPRERGVESAAEFKGATIIGKYFEKMSSIGEPIELHDVLYKHGYTCGSDDLCGRLATDEWERPGSQTGARSLIEGEVINGLPGVNVFSSADPKLKCDSSNGSTGRRYNLIQLWVALEFGDVDDPKSWKKAAEWCHTELEKHEDLFADIEDEPAEPVKSLTNYRSEKTEVDGKQKTIKKGRPINAIVADLQTLFSLRRVQGVLMSEDLSPLDKRDKLFGEIQRKVPVFWHNGEGCVTKSEFFEAATAMAKTYSTVRGAPHFPQVDGVLYCHEFQPGDVSDFYEFADRFRPATAIDRQLILAFFATPLWGGPGGSRPFFVPDTGGKRGGGKTKLVDYASQLANFGIPGTHTVKSPKEWDALAKQLVNAGGYDPPIVHLDNFKGGCISSASLESLVTTPIVNGWKVYVGAEGKPNLYTYAATGNFMTLSEDMASRCVQIQLKPAEFNSEWDAMMEATNWRRVIEGVGAFFQLPTKPITEPNRFPLWCRDVLGRLENPDALLRTIRERAKSLSGETDEALEIRNSLVRMIRSAGLYGRSVFLPSHRIAKHFNGENLNGKRWCSRSVGRYLNRFATSEHLMELENRKSMDCNGFLWSEGDGEIDHSLAKASAEDAWSY